MSLVDDFTEYLHRRRRAAVTIRKRRAVVTKLLKSKLAPPASSRTASDAKQRSPSARAAGTTKTPRVRPPKW
ncbi:hypothetical protein, partial [Microbacterium aurantiacum]